ncbi:MAG: helix-turn-helix transcriptional regulator [Firmicutes bacterium]|nr:helix-turn-helix transcriptional regulator [Bacillota bacterium]
MSSKGISREHKPIDESLRKLDLKEMGRRIRSRRLFFEMSREQLATKLGVTQQFIADIESGNKGVSIKRLYALCQILNVSADYILAGERLDEEDDKDLARAREKVMKILCNCDEKQLKGIEKIVAIYSDGTKMD